MPSNHIATPRSSLKIIDPSSRSDTPASPIPAQLARDDHAKIIERLGTVESKVDGLIDDSRTDRAALDGIRREARAMRQRVEAIDKRTESLEKVSTEHSKTLADISSAVVRIENRLLATEQTAKDAARDASRASGTNELVSEFAKVELEERRDELAARKDKRTAVWSAFGKGAAFVFSVAGLTVIGTLALKACGREDPAPARPTPAASSSASALP